MMAAQKHGASLITTIVGLGALLLGAAGVFGQLQDALNTIWEVKPKPGRGMWGYVRDRFLSLAMVLGTGFLLLVSMALTTFLSALSGSLAERLPVSVVVLHGLNFIVSLAVISVLFAMIFKFLPDVKVPFRKVWVGAIGTALLFTAGKYLLALYLGRASTTSSYGAAGSVIIVLMWVYYASVILFFGAEFTQVYTRQTGAQVVPSEYAIPVTQQERAQQGLSSDQSQPVPRRPSFKGPPRGVPAQPVANAVRRTPGGVVREEPWRFVGLMLAAGVASGLLLRFKSVRKALRLYAFVRKAF
jgi:membrane protein